MNRLQNIFACLCPTLLLAIGLAHAQTVFWSDGFEANAGTHWTANGPWHIGPPASGPSSAHSGNSCATTQGYSANADGRITCTNYLSNSNSLVIPDADLSPTLMFWHWINFANAIGYVEINTTNGWQQLSPTYVYPLTTGGQWVPTYLDLSAYAGQSVQFAFHFTAGPCCGNAQGWYVDDVAVTVISAPEVTGPGDQTIKAGDTFEGTVSATNNYGPDAKYTFQLISKPANAQINSTNGYITWPTTNTMAPGTNLFAVRVTDDSSPPQVVTNSFVVTVVNPWLPVVTVPGTQTTFPGHTLWATNSAANDYSTVAFTFKLLAGPTNLGLTISTNGVIKWNVTNTQPAGSFTNIVQATYTGTPSLSGTNSFVIIVLTNLPSPVLMVPAAQTLYGGQNLNVSVSATNTTFPSHTYLYQTNAATPAGVVLNSTNGRLTWLPANAQRGNTYTLSIRATDQQASQLSATNSFIVTVKLDALQPATFTAPPQIVSATNGFQFTLNTQPSLTWRIDASTNLSLWQPLFTNQTGPGTTLQLTDLLATNYLRRFYRAALQ